MTKKLLYLMPVVLVMIFSLFIGSKVLAAEHTLYGDYAIDGGLAVRGDIYADHNVINFNPTGFSGVDPTISFMRGDSLFKEMGDMYIISDDYIHLGYTKPIMDQEGILIQNASEILNKSRSAHGRLEAGTIKVNTLLDFGDGSIADFTNAEVIGFAPLESMSEEIDDKVSIEGDTMLGILNANGGINISSGQFQIDSEGYSYISSPMVLYSNAPLDVNSNANFHNGININDKFTIDYMGESYIDGNMVLSGNATLTVNNTAFLYGGINGGNGFVVNSQGGIFTDGVVDFSGAASFQLPLQDRTTAGVCDTGSKGKMYFDTNLDTFWGCNGTDWRMFSTTIPD